MTQQVGVTQQQITDFVMHRVMTLQAGAKGIVAGAARVLLFRSLCLGLGVGFILMPSAVPTVIALAFAALLEGAAFWGRRRARSMFTQAAALRGVLGEFNSSVTVGSPDFVRLLEDCQRMCGRGLAGDLALALCGVCQCDQCVSARKSPEAAP